MPDGYEDEARDALLTKAVRAWEDDPALDAGPLGGGSGDSVACYLRAYYQRVATEDLAPSMNALHASFGVGAAAAPVIIGASRRASGGVGWGIGAIAAVFVGVSLLVATHPSPSPPR